MKIRRDFFLRSTTGKILIYVGIAFIVSAVILSCSSLHWLKTSNERRDSLAEKRTELYEADNIVAQLLGNETALIRQFVELRKKALAFNGTQEEIDKLQAAIQTVDLDREIVDADVREYDAQERAIERSMSADEIKVIRDEQGEDRMLRIFSLLLSIGMLFFSYGLAVYLSKKRA